MLLRLWPMLHAKGGSAWAGSVLLTKPPPHLARAVHLEHCVLQVLGIHHVGACGVRYSGSAECASQRSSNLVLASTEGFTPDHHAFKQPLGRPTPSPLAARCAARSASRTLSLSAASISSRRATSCRGFQTVGKWEGVLRRCTEQLNMRAGECMTWAIKCAW